jgi:2,5-dioxopentanoate dehydrogenase
MFKEATIQDIEAVMQQAATAFPAFRKTTGMQRASLLDAIAGEIENLGDALIQMAASETHLSQARLTGERARTTGQLRMFAALLREGSWAEATIDKALPQRNPPRPDLRKMLTPLGPVVVFGASNFPFAYSTAGGDTASALAAGCPVVVKAHPAHAQTSQMVADAIAKAIQQCGITENSFQHVHGGFETGKALVQHPATAAVGFTGSFSGGKALYDYAQQRAVPIPVFAEMGSINPVVFLPDTIAKNADALAKQYAASVTLGMGQFCTNPGLLLAITGENLDAFVQLLGNATAAVQSENMLHSGIHKAYYEKMSKALQQQGVTLVDQSAHTLNDIEALPTIVRVSAAVFLQNPVLHEEVFGPYSLLVQCDDAAELTAVLQSVRGQLTTTLMGTEEDLREYQYLLDELINVAGRIVINGVPTGVDVCASMVHGGPFPASTDGRFTAVGPNAIKRWCRPVCFQNWPDWLLPDELKEENPLGITRLEH